MKNTLSSAATCHPSATSSDATRPAARKTCRTAVDGKADAEGGSQHGAAVADGNARASSRPDISEWLRTSGARIAGNRAGDGDSQAREAGSGIAPIALECGKERGGDRVGPTNSARDVSSVSLIRVGVEAAARRAGDTAVRARSRGCVDPRRHRPRRGQPANRGGNRVSVV